MSAGVVIVGLGQIGMGYDLNLDPVTYVYTHARAFSQHPAFHLQAAVDPDPGRCETFTAHYGRPAYGTLDAALTQHQPEVVVIAVPTPRHGATVHQLLERARPRFVLCEKPLSYDVAEARGMVNACAAAGVELFVNYLRRADPGVAEVKRRLDSGKIAEPIKGVAWYSKGFFHNGSHVFNLLEHLLGPMTRSTVMNGGRLWAGTDPEPDVQVTFARGEIVFLAAWEEAFSHYTFELLSPSGRLRYEQGGSRIEWQPSIADAQLPGYSVLSAQPEIIESGMDRCQWNVVEQLSRVMRRGASDLCTGDQALQSLTSMSGIAGAHA